MTVQGIVSRAACLTRGTRRERPVEGTVQDPKFGFTWGRPAGLSFASLPTVRSETGQEVGADDKVFL